MPEYVEPPDTYECEVCWRRYPKTMFYSKLWEYKRICDHCLGFVLDKGQGVSYNVPIEGE